MEFTAEFGAGVVPATPPYATRAVMLVAVAVGVLVAIRRRHALVAALRATYGAPTAPLDLAVFRIAVCVGLATKLSLARALFFSDLPSALQFPPYGMETIAAAIPPGRPLVAGASALLVLCLAAGAIGFRTRTAMGGVCLLGVYVLGVPNLYGKVNHHNHLLWFAALLAASDSGAALSIDAARRRRRGVGPPGPSVAFGAPLAVARLLIGLIYFFPGWWKLWLSGPQWFLGDALPNVMQNLWFVGHGHPWPALLASPGLLAVAGAATIAFELSFLLLIHVPRTRGAAAVAALCFHLVTGIALGIWFSTLVVCYVVFVDWGRLSQGSSGASAGPRSVRPVLKATSVVLVAGVVWTGALPRVTAWPFACYPIFAPAPLPRMPVLRLVTVDAEDRERPVDATELRRRMGAERWSRLGQRIASTSDAAAQRARAAALVEVWRRTAGVTATNVRLYVETDTTVLGEADRNPLARVELFDGSESRPLTQLPPSGLVVQVKVRGNAPVARPPVAGGKWP